MRVAVLGAGVTGITTAYYLDQQGFDVTVIDRQPLAAEETSYANGGQLSYSQPFPWSSPELPLNLLRWLGRNDAPLVFKLKADPYLWAWGLRYLFNCQSHRFYRHAEKILELAKISRQSLHALIREENLEFEHEQRGILKLFSGAKEEEEAMHRRNWLKEHGLDQKFLTRAECMEIEPALKRTTSLFTGGTWSPGDGSGNAREFTRSLVAKLKENGVEFLFETSIDGFERDSCKITSVHLNGVSRQFDKYVLCAGAYSKPIAEMAGINLPLYPVKGYSVTIPVKGSNTAPLTSITDESRHIVISRLGDQLRAAGTAEINGFQTKENRIREDMVLDAVMELFPQCGDAEKAVRWSGLRPMTTDSVPLIGKARYDNFYTNTGHGPLGWTLACGSAELLANNIAGKATKLDIAGYSVDRFN